MAKVFGLNKGQNHTKVQVTTVENPAQDIQLTINTDVILNKNTVMEAINNLWIYIEEHNEVAE